jgi:hypothetical protein
MGPSIPPTIPGTRRATLRRRLDSAPRTRLHHEHDPLAIALVGHAHDDDVFNVVAALHRGFHLVREDLLPSGVDAQRAATEDGDDSIGVDRSQVARKRPTLASGLDERGPRLVGVPEIPDGDVAAAGQVARPVQTDLLAPCPDDGGSVLPIASAGRVRALPGVVRPSGGP